MDEKKSCCIIMDNGSGTFRSGFGGEKTPKLVFPTIIGIPNQKGRDDGLDPETKFIGCDAQQKRGLLTLKYPIQGGIVRDWDQMESIWDYCFEKLHAHPSNGYPVLLTEPPLNPKRNRERTTQIMFETFSAPSVFIGIQAVLTLYSCGRTTGCVLDSGEGVTYTVPIYSGYAVTHSIHRVDYGGSTLTEYLGRLLRERGYDFSTSAEMELVREVKEKLCRVSYSALDGDDDGLVRDSSAGDDGSTTQQLETEDGRVITIGDERYKCPEALFDPSLIGMETHCGIPSMIHSTISSTDIDLRTDLWQNVIISGGNTFFAGFLERVQKELTRLAPGTTKVRSYRPPDSALGAAWVGGSLLASLPAFKECWIDQEEYEEIGPVVIHRKCW